MDSTKPMATLFVSLLIASLALTVATGEVEHNQHLHNHRHQSHTTAASTSNVTVQTSSGLLVGLETALPNSGEPGNQTASVLKFLAVPYAQAPVGQLRFKRPLELPAERASAQVDATRYGKTCPQFRHLARFVSPLLNLDHEHQISEDCLQLNVFVPSHVMGNSRASGRLEPEKQLPVIVWIPGEGFDYADARQYDGSQLAYRTSSIVVTVQYRVGILGFLGNLALHDQLAALRWVQRNINAFGGDQERVTLMGRFSGSMSISALLTAPNQDLIRVGAGENSRTLFKRAILMSGIAVDDWIIEEDQEEKVKQVLELARERGYCNQAQIADDSCLQTMSVDRLLEISGFGWKLVRDQQLIGQEGPIEAVRNNRLPSDVEAILLGETETEGTLCLYRHLLMRASSNYAQLIEEDRLTSEDLFEVLRDDSRTYFKFNVSATNPIQMALEALTGEQTQADELHKNREKYLNACSSFMVKAHNMRFKRSVQANIAESERHLVAQKPLEIYHYGLKYKPSFSLAPDYVKTAAHGDDVPLVFGLVLNQPRASIDPSDLLMTHRMMAYIGNFVHGNQPLLQEHKQIETSSSSTGLEASSQLEQAELTFPSRRSWTSDEQIHHLDASETELLGRRSRPAELMSPASLRLVVIESSAQAQPTIEQQLNAEPGDSGMTRSQRLLELHQRRQDERRRRLAESSEGTNPTQTNLTGETSFVVVLLLSASIVILALMALCIVLSVLVIRCNVDASRKASLVLGCKQAGSQHFKSSLSSSSTCNICDDSQTANSGGAMEAVLNQASSRKNNERAFCNLFAKLKGHHHQPTVPAELPASVVANTTPCGNQPAGTTTPAMKAQPGGPQE